MRKNQRRLREPPECCRHLAGRERNTAGKMPAAPLRGGFALAGGSWWMSRSELNMELSSNLERAMTRSNRRQPPGRITVALHTLNAEPIRHAEEQVGHRHAADFNAA